MRAIYLFLVVAFLCICFQAESQVSQGGRPIEPLLLKSSQIMVVKMPAVDNERMLMESLEDFSQDPALKPFKFARTFDVDFTPANSGQWINSEQGFNIWQIKIQSEGAFSINLILQPFRLPPNARLFVFNEDKSHIIGAFTAYNNKPFNSLALSPVRGETIILQYEEPVDPEFKGELGIVKVNHDFAGILTDPSGRRPLGKSGSCNIDINCGLAKEWETVKNSVCRVIVAGSEVCTGTLINNTKEDKTPYILTANHCFTKHVNGEQNTVFLFNYESPYCGALDGDITNSVSGSLKIASSDTLDFSLVKMTLAPPPEYRPYFAGWDKSGNTPDSVVCIHHPIGDIKKIALDYNNPVISSYPNRPDFYTLGFWKTLTWEYGTTQAGSSGGPYFNQNHLIVGTLTGGAASCSNPVNDYFERIDLAWDHYPDSAKQLKCWLDPKNSGTDKLDGIDGYDGEEYCEAFTNLMDGDAPALSQMRSPEGSLLGFWGGTNQNGITEYSEKFSIPGDETLDGISLGVAKIIKNSAGTASFITIKVYNGKQTPETLVYSKDVLVYDLAQDAMNYIGFDGVVQPADTFFVGFDVSNVHEKVTIVLFTATRKNDQNSLLYKQNSLWFDYHEEMDTLSAALAFELVACNVENNTGDTPRVNDPVELKIYPNPASSILNLLSSAEIQEEDISVFDLLGKEIGIKTQKSGTYEVKIFMSGNRSGIYFVRVKNSKISSALKFYFNPNYNN